ncbi:succinate-semialdehyde dehydrogenase (NADP(+)) [Enterovibrio norvegicus]|uniref:NAD-dependent succinate-semialdehyde dehydrogenase n=1 Tax=Enterovibrio norvegicus TaxID=188144 RepID=A0ABV4L4Q2_9GAMM|nr:NAD-dependent succinate-semialdehyde dehydrogenase [Enterovibrio norvegicus]MCC4797123.1 NAD-dependent succinate-semialdehyde dehydrogenase [Enterovibrio norvegicus]OEF58182.1 succinate-semialdehyde dehydrogenase (NADP(+)) [Enterovibrio norvegicus]PMI31351.1 succinate-semialdehyde dehydrogenase (NADP(+)) [Enterovibrio norvegicus]PMI40848.1 succinate-semialdehyde dehydrogenase (NADP(+)) [Enterovibrio norvegicus]PMN56264.1 succinate-semialdehyde dehydrogenase (NADP(+)) [Enterovibrio norvegicu
MKQIKNHTLLSALCDNLDNTIAVTNPADQTLIGHVQAHSREEVEATILRARDAQKAWAKTTAKQRAAILMRWYELLMENQEDLARIMTLEQGKPLAESRGEVAYGASFVQWFAEEGKRAYGETIPTPLADRRIMTIKQPVGVAAAITPWNFPIAMITRKAAPALAAGCSFVAKPAIQTPLSAYAVVELARQAGLPDDLLAVVTSEDAPMIGDVFCNSTHIQKISFTGSTNVGRILMKQSAESVKRVSMELGGNAPFIVFDDADIDLAVKGAITSKFRNAGQTCVCANRFYVHDAVYEEFVHKFSLAVDELTVGNGLDDDVVIGPLIDDNAKLKIKSLLDQALQQGATVSAGGDDLGGQFFEPTVLTHVSHSMDIVQAEIFGPIAPVIRFSDDEELIEMANDTIYGLASYFYSKDINRIFKIAEALDYGMVGVNEGVISTEVAPFGGVKQSGIGREGARQGIDEYLNTKYICLGSM